MTFKSEEDALRQPHLRIVTDPVTVTAPSELAATDISTTSVTLEWEDNSSNETAFELERKEVDGGTWESLDDNIAPNTTEYEDDTVDADTEYLYRIRATAGSYNQKLWIATRE